MKPASIKPVRCAIYTRVSTEHGLDQAFNSLDAQYDAASAYMKSGPCRLEPDPVPL
jgi:site-specific DNA recombinase